MKLFQSLQSHRKKRSRRKHYIELDPRRYWVVLLSVFVLFIALELVYFSLLFLKTNKNIDSPAIPTLQTNESKIKSMEATLQNVEEALSKRTGQPGTSPQNLTPVQ